MSTTMSLTPQAGGSAAAGTYSFDATDAVCYDIGLPPGMEEGGFDRGFDMEEAVRDAGGLQFDNLDQDEQVMSYETPIDDAAQPVALLFRAPGKAPKDKPFRSVHHVQAYQKSGHAVKVLKAARAALEARASAPHRKNAQRIEGQTFLDCRRCGLQKPVDCFYPSRAHMCKECHGDVAKNRREQVLQQEMDNPQPKECTVCRALKPLSQFYAGFARCKECNNVIRKLQRDQAKAAK